MSASEPRILLIDDDPALLQCLFDMLMYRLRPAVVVAQSPSQDVASQVQHGNYDVVICDLKMPKQGGLEVISGIKAVKPQQAVILMTGCIEESIEQQARKEGAVAILRKPLDRDEVVRVIRSLLEVSRQDPAVYDPSRTTASEDRPC